MFAVGDWCSLRYAFPGCLFPYLSVFFIQCPHCVRKSSSSISLRNAKKKSHSFSRLMRSLIQSGGLRSLESLRPSIPWKLDPARPPFSCPCYARRQQPWPSRLKGSIRSEPKSSCFRVYRFENLLSWIPLISPSHRQQSALIPWCQRASSCLLSCPKTVYHWRKTLPRQGSPLSLSRLPRLASFGAPGVRPLGNSFLVEDAVNVLLPLDL